ncbi:S-adenosylmethionine decarboxylase [Meredithblackwellia eburnea MCA 4105]
MVAAPLDSQISILSDSSPGPFEGPEKLLELWFAPSEQHVQDSNFPIRGHRRGNDKWIGLRQVAKDVWDSMLDEVQCKVLSVIEGEEVDAYLLSESSMFVWPHKLILKTCGTTTLLLGLPTLLRIASETCGFHGVWRCFYSRKTFMFPDRQKGPHKDWNQEMSFLDKIFEDSSAYTVGRMNGDHWLLYLTPPRSDVLQPYALASSSLIRPQSPSNDLADLSATLSTSASLVSSSPSFLNGPPPSVLQRQRQRPEFPSSPEHPDQTLEILMSRLHPSACASFYHPDSSPTTPYTSPLFGDDPLNGDAHALGAALTKRLGIDALLPNATVDSFLFSPCGYSSNAVLNDRYATIHVTPEVDYSYASFETNFVPTKSLQGLVMDVLKIFRPAKFSVTLFVSAEEEEDEGSGAGGGGGGGGAAGVVTPLAESSKMLATLRDLELVGYTRKDRIVYEFEGYSLVYAVFEEGKTKEETSSAAGR